MTDDERPPFLVCVPATLKSLFTDNVQGTCIQCDRAVQHRPNVITPCRLICIECFVEAGLEPGDELRISDASIREFLDKLKH